MKGLGNAKLILLQPSLHKPGSGGASLGSPQRLWLLAFVSFFTFVSLFTLFPKQPALPSTSSALEPSLPASAASSSSGPLPADLFDALLHYATVDPAPASRMPDADVRAVAAALRRRGPCNLLVFGMGHETLLWRSLNSGGRTVFLDESEYYVSRFEERHPGALEAYDVGYTTKVSELAELLAAARAERQGDCRPVQNLLFSDCRLGINDLPNQLYDVAWDVILVDGPRGYSPSSPGRVSAIFTAAVMARSARGHNGTTEVFVHDYEREVERVSSQEFLCAENLVAASGQLAHFAIQRQATGARGSAEFDFCLHRNSSSSSSSSAA